MRKFNLIKEVFMAEETVNPNDAQDAVTGRANAQDVSEQVSESEKVQHSQVYGHNF